MKEKDVCSAQPRLGKNLKQECDKRSLVYETSCHTCYEKEKEKIEKEEKDEKERKRKISQIKIYKYVGETSRSIYERAIEHQNDMEQLKPGSHFLKGDTIH